MTVPLQITLTNQSKTLPDILCGSNGEFCTGLGLQNHQLRQSQKSEMQKKKMDLELEELESSPRFEPVKLAG